MKKQKTICILTGCLPNVKPWDPDSIHTGIAGSEESIIYMADALAAKGWKVVVIFIYGGPPKGSRYSNPEANPQYIPNGGQCNIQYFDVIVGWRTPTVAKQVKDKIGKKLYLWPHDILTEIVPLEHIEAFDDVLWLSEWQRSQWMSTNPGYAKFTKIFGNGIEPRQFPPIHERSNPYSCIYGSNYARGLETLLDLWPRIKKAQPKATLDIYYGWAHSGWLTYEPEKEPQMRKQIAGLRDVHEHGRVSHKVLALAYSNSSFWTYPCDFPETFCITALKAQFSGAVPVILEDFALKETVRHGFRCHRPEDYFDTLMQAFAKAETITLDERKEMREFILKEYTWEKVADKWIDLFEKNL